MNLNLMFAANFTLLGANLTAAYLKLGEKGFQILVKPAAVDDTGTITIGKMVEEVNGLIATLTGTGNPKLTEDMIKAKLPAGLSNIMSLEIKLEMVYLYVKSEDGEKSKIVDFAFKISLDAIKVIPPTIKMLNIQSMALAVWNTTDKAVTDKMQLALPSEMNK